ncbi:MAG: hypothetical protein DWQ42_10520 [Planctomycetota bacterium]|nr:MAG: hypothetical protein DWQ42_10520 [Planctomycetota bacterium]REK46573.1 MAG: hypothetical protein DWQ46_06785 [Planctomycetota bacterium]
MKRITASLLRVSVWLAISLGGLTSVADAADKLVEPTVVLEGLANPTSLTISPDGELFVAESGAGRVVHVVGDQPEALITDFAVVSAQLAGRQLAFGPTSLVALDRQTLAVGHQDSATESARISVFRLPAPGESIPASEAIAEFVPRAGQPRPTSEKAAVTSLVLRSGEGNDSKSIYATLATASEAGWVGQVDWRSGRAMGRIDPFSRARPATDTRWPRALALSTQSPNQYLVVADAGQPSADRDSQISFHDLKSRLILLQIPIGLYDVSGVAYSERTPYLYVLDLAMANPQEGGLFRLDQTIANGRQSVKAVKIAALESPTALAFAPNGCLFVTTRGPVTREGEPPSGKLLMFDTGL